MEVFSDGSTRPVSPIYCRDASPIGGGSGDSGSSGGGSYGGNPGRGDPDPDPKIEPTDNFLNNAKLNCIWEKLTKNNSFNNYLKNFDQDFSTVDLIFDTSTNLPNNVNGRTDNSTSDKIYIYINENTISQKPVLGVARTIFHEAIHAELFRKVRSVNNQISIDDFPGIYDYYRRYLKNWQHQQMAAHYIDIMANMLKEFDGGQKSDQYYKDISWSGLYKFNDKNNPGTLIYSTAFSELSSTEQQRIINAISNLRNNGNKICN